MRMWPEGRLCSMLTGILGGDSGLNLRSESQTHRFAHLSYLDTAYAPLQVRVCAASLYYIPLQAGVCAASLYYIPLQASVCS